MLLDLVPAYANNPGQIDPPTLTTHHSQSTFTVHRRLVAASALATPKTGNYIGVLPLGALRACRGTERLESYQAIRTGRSSVNASSRCIRREVRYSGHVQGVGFRFNTQRVAANFAVDGYVRNLPDGRVHLVAEGKAAEVERFLQAVRDRMGDYIEDVSDDTLAASGEFNGFHIRY